MYWLKLNYWCLNWNLTKKCFNLDKVDNTLIYIKLKIIWLRLSYILIKVE